MPQNVDAKDSGHECHGKGVKKYVVQSVNGHERCLGQPPKIHMHLCMCAYATTQKLICHGNYCELILGLARASCRLSFATRPPAVSTKSVPRHFSLKKWVQIHDSL